jgi:hypothetical protein
MHPLHGTLISCIFGLAEERKTPKKRAHKAAAAACVLRFAHYGSHSRASH